jgi:cation diffusion facilitator family transporter
MELANKNIQVQKWVAVLSVVLLIIKLTAYYLTDSLSILTDALEGIVNIIAGFVGLYSLYLSAKPRDDDHPYGHGKIEFVSSLLEGGLIITAGLIIIYHSVVNLISPSPIQKIDIGTLLIAFTAVANLTMGMWCIRTGKRTNSVALISSGRHLQTDTITTAGIIVGLSIVYFTNLVWLDSVVAIVAALVILFTGYKILRTSLAGILDETDKSLLIQLVEILNRNRRANWMDLHNLRIIKYGNVLHIDCHLTLPWYLNMHEAHLEIDELTQLIRGNFGSSVEFFIHTDGCLEASCRICSKHDCAVRLHLQEKRIEWTVENISSNTKHTVDTM